MGVFFGFTLVFVNVFFAEARFSWTDCTPAESPLKITSMEIGPDPIAVPGDLRLSINGASTGQIGSSAMSISLKRKSFLGEITIPCLLNIGSCKYDDVCTLVDQMIQEDWAGIMADLGRQIKAMLNSSGINPSQCPQPPRALQIQDALIHLPEVPAVLSIFAAGDYHARIEMTDNASQATVLCLDTQVSITEAGCSGLGCLFGRK